ncbi:MAG: AMP-binding protein [Clostridia bacterium]|nr:AMP-binding protein [Clostridia bacterium]
MGSKAKNYKDNYTDFVADLKEMVELAENKFSERNAFCFERDGEEKSITFSQFANDIRALGTYFYSLGIKNSKIALIGENSYEWIVTYFAAVNGSNVIVPLDKELAYGEAINLIKNSESCALVYSDLKKNIAEECHNDEELKVEHYINMKDFADILEKGYELIDAGDNSFVDEKIDRERMCAIIYTSGTTGNPKGVMLSHKNLASDVVFSIRNLDVPLDTVVVLPLNHTMGAMAGVLCQIHLGSCVYINNNLKSVLKDINKGRPRHMSVVPLFIETFYKNIWRNVEKQGKTKLLKSMIKVSNALRKVGIDLRRVFFKSVLDAFGGRLEMLISGGAPIDDLYMDGFDALGIQLINGYGITECSPIVATNRTKFYRSGSVGVAVPGVEVKIIDKTESGEGEICVKGDTVMMGYYKNPEATEEAFVDGWFKTGDIGYIDDDGFIYITGRKKNMILLANGKNVYPEEIETLVLRIEGVNEAMVYGANTHIAVEIYAEDASTQDVIRKEIDKINETLPTFKRLREIVFRDEEFEKTTTKKIKRFKY